MTGIVKFAHHLIERKSVDWFDIQAYLREHAGQREPGDWSEVFTTLWHLRSSDRGRERALAILLHPILATTDNMPFVPVLMTTYEGWHSEVYLRPYFNCELQQAVSLFGPYHGLRQFRELGYAYDVRIKSKTYRFMFSWSFERQMRHRFSVLQTVNNQEVFLPIYDLNDRLNAVAGYLYGLASWVHRSRHRLPGWDQSLPLASARNSRNPETPAAKRKPMAGKLLSKAGASVDGGSGLSTKDDTGCIPSASSWLKKKMKTTSSDSYTPEDHF